jgi:hypothetical protein
MPWLAPQASSCVDVKAQTDALQILVLWMGAMPATTNLAVAAACTVGLSDQLCLGSLLNSKICTGDDADSSAAESEQLYRSRLIILFHLQ